MGPENNLLPPISAASPFLHSGAASANGGRINQCENHLKSVRAKDVRVARKTRTAEAITAALPKRHAAVARLLPAPGIRSTSPN